MTKELKKNIMKKDALTIDIEFLEWVADEKTFIGSKILIESEKNPLFVKVVNKKTGGEAVFYKKPTSKGFDGYGSLNGLKLKFK